MDEAESNFKGGVNKINKAGNFTNHLFPQYLNAGNVTMSLWLTEHHSITMYGEWRYSSMYF